MDKYKRIIYYSSKKNDIKSVRGIGLSGQMHGLVMYDISNNILGNAIVWLDKRSQKQVVALKKIILSGGGIKYIIWAKILANILDMPIELINIEAHSPYGATVFAKFAQEDFAELEVFYEKVIKPVQTILPKKKYAEKYRTLFFEYKKHTNYLDRFSKAG